MKYVIAILIILAVSFLFGCMLAGIAVITGAADEFEREMEDREQAEYLRKWNERKHS